MKYRAQQGNQRLTTTLSNELRVLQEYHFNCSSTNITRLILGIDVRRATGNRRLFPSVQVFRPNGNIVNQYDLVTGSERTIYYSTTNVSTSGVYEYSLNPPISVMDEDLLAVSQPSQQNSVVRVYYSNQISFSSSQPVNYGFTTVDLSSPLILDELILIYPVTGKTPVFTKLKLKNQKKLAVIFSFCTLTNACNMGYVYLPYYKLQHSSM